MIVSAWNNHAKREKLTNPFVGVHFAESHGDEVPTPPPHAGDYLVYNT